MKRYIILCLTVIVSVGMSFGQINKKQSDDIILEYIENNLLSDCQLHYYSDTISNEVRVVTCRDTLIRQNSYAYFIDEMPMANWYHPCRYVFVNKDSGVIEVFFSEIPPSEFIFIPMFEECPIEQQEMSSEVSNMFSMLQYRASYRFSDLHKKYAVILSGGNSPYSNHLRYWNNCSFIYKVLVNIYGVLPNNIYVLMSDGTDPDVDRHLPDGSYDSSPLDLDGNGTDDIQYSATKQNITTVFDALSRRITTEDDLFIFTTDHGGRWNNQVYLVLWNGAELYPMELAKEVNKIKARNISIVMGQCHSGGFIPALEAQNRVIMTACKEDEKSYPRSSMDYDEFVYYWISAMAKKYPNNRNANADANSDGFISMEEAFLFAQSNDKQNETPQYRSHASTLGQIVTLRELTCSAGIENELVTSNRSVSGCEIIVNDVTIENNGKLTLSYDDATIIEAPFDMKEDASLDITNK